ncbi:phosphoesterase RecJ domain protein [Staphylothermus hellenicus DSM 12710]|uniref:Phosphoesterase RecJ domain protein n=1 Tax=Staphylothermus hellenicus (strain DSM 12710 / JCM 10830 / BK20S6-10-b1 / P8) TaxID=591019 RepID=D7DA94_STAHD|nr:phosphoesterase RecJ domain protein [Staphylothermus hellenicus DSM 12710]
MKENLENINKLRRFLLSNKGLVYGILTHKNADPDAVSSMLILKNFLESLKNTVYLILPEGLNAASKNVLNNLNIDIDFIDPFILQWMDKLIDTYIIVDTSSPVQLGQAINYVYEKPYIVIDHHQPGQLISNSMISLSYRVVSNCELVYLLLRDTWWFSPLEATICITGILYDSRRFVYIDKYIFEIIDELINIYNGNYEKAFNSLQKKMDISERIARLKGAQRLRIKRIGEYIVATTHVSAFEGSVARAIIDLGADIVFVVSTNDKLRIVGRSTRDFVKKTSISLGKDIMPIIGEIIGGGGGGHDTAGVAEGTGKPVDVLKITLNILERKLRKLDNK